MCYFAHAYYGGDRIAKDECAWSFTAITWLTCKRIATNPLTEDDIITHPDSGKGVVLPGSQDH